MDLSAASTVGGAVTRLLFSSLLVWKARPYPIGHGTLGSKCFRPKVALGALGRYVGGEFEDFGAYTQ